MKITTTYSVKIKDYNHIFKETIAIYRNAVDFVIKVCLDKWDEISDIKDIKFKKAFIEHLIHATKEYPDPEYKDYDKKFYKMPLLLTRSVISEALGEVSSYKSNLKNWEKNPDGKEPAVPRAGYCYPALYKDGMYGITGTYTAKIKVYTRNTWDWIFVKLRKSDVDYINRRCSNKVKKSPTLQKRGKEWFLDFPFKENVELKNVPVNKQIILAVDLGINTAATISVMTQDGTILGRYFCKLSKEIDSLNHKLNKIKKCQQHGNRKMPRLWARVKGINKDISSKTANYIMDIAALYHADTIVFEHLNTSGKKKGRKKQKLHMWRHKEVLAMVTIKAHRLGMRISTINPYHTSKLAFDGSGLVDRGYYGGFNTYELCKFQNGKVYNCDLSATYNIGARYFIREILKSLPKKVRLVIEAKVPQCTKRSTCTFSTLISLNAELKMLAS